LGVVLPSFVLLAKKLANVLLAKRLMPAIATERARVFGLEEERRTKGAIAGEGVLLMSSQGVLFMD